MLLIWLCRLSKRQIENTKHTHSRAIIKATTDNVDGGARFILSIHVRAIIRLLLHGIQRPSRGAFCWHVCEIEIAPLSSLGQSSMKPHTYFLYHYDDYKIVERQDLYQSRHKGCQGLPGMVCTTQKVGTKGNSMSGPIFSSWRIVLAPQRYRYS